MDIRAARLGDRVFLGVSALLFVASVTVTIAWGTSMSAMCAVPMPGGWTMSMAWMPMPGQTWSDAAASFLGMWMVMMAAMMLPSLIPVLWRFRQRVATAADARVNRLTVTAGAGYFVVWTLLGVAAFPFGVTLAALAMQQPSVARAVPAAVGVVVTIAGAVQLTRWKARHLACCRQRPGDDVPGDDVPAHDASARADAATAWRYGLRHARHCAQCCAGPMAILLAIGVMDLHAMAVVTAAITAERLAPAGAAVARAIGVAAIVAGLLLIARATVLA